MIPRKWISLFYTAIYIIILLYGCGTEGHTNLNDKDMSLVKDVDQLSSGSSDLFDTTDIRSSKNLQANIHSEFRSISRLYREPPEGFLQAGATVVIMGGFSSCIPGSFAGGLFRRAYAMLKVKAEAGEYFRYFVSCFMQTSGSVFYYTSSDADRVHRIAATNVSRIIAGGAADTPIYFIGHSWGGWLALKSVLGLSHALSVSGLATIDPISPSYCNAPVMVKAYLRSMFSFRPDPGCTQAPQDIDRSHLAAIAVRTQWWYHFYQDNSGFLHSSPMRNAENHYIEYTYLKPWQVFNGHRFIDTDERVWSKFENQIVSD